MYLKSNCDDTKFIVQTYIYIYSASVEWILVVTSHVACLRQALPAALSTTALPRAAGAGPGSSERQPGAAARGTCAGRCFTVVGYVVF